MAEEKSPDSAKAQDKKEGKDSPTKENIILDALFTKGYYEEELVLPGGRTCVFRTRTTEMALDIVSRLEEKDIQTRGRYDKMQAVYTLAGSLITMGGKPLPGDFDKKVTIVKELPGPVTDMLVTELVKFDNFIVDIYTAKEAKN